MTFIERAEEWLLKQPWRAEAASLLTLLGLWALYFWRFWAFNPADRVSYPEGDFSGQFLSFGAYQARRLLSGEIPLWNPFNYGGHPFLADTQAAVFYPPRLLTIFASPYFGGWSYALLQAEVLTHYLLASLLMYAFVRQVTGSRLAGLVSSLTFTYGGYLTGYPPLQLAVLETGIWLPIILLGIFKGTEGAVLHSRWLGLAGLGLGTALLAGHPQTALLMLYVTAAYGLHRGLKAGLGWPRSVVAVAVVISLGLGLAAVQLLPGLEYTRLTTRAGLGFDQLAGGFPFTDLLVFIWPRALTVWSPLYSGITALGLSAAAIWIGWPSARFLAVVGVVALVLSFGGGTIFYELLYLIAPGFGLFRGQERAAYVIAFAIAVLAGMGAAALQKSEPPQRFSLALGVAAIVLWALAIEAFIGGALVPAADVFALLQAAFLAAMLASLSWLVVGHLGSLLHGSIWQRPAWLRSAWPAAVLVLITFDLFSITSGTNWEPLRAADRRLSGPLIQPVGADEGLFRVDGRLGLGENYGTLLGIQDMRGTSPLRLQALNQYMSRLPQYRQYQLLSVRYVFTDAVELEVPSQIITEAEASGQVSYLHKIDDPMPRAWLAYNIFTVSDDAQALGLLSDPSFPIRTSVTLNQVPHGDFPTQPPEGASVEILTYAPETIRLRVITPTDGILVLSEWDYPGWQAYLEGVEQPILRVNAGLRGLSVPAGEHTVTFVYRPTSFQVGSWISAAAACLALAALIFNFKAGKRKGAKPQDAANQDQPFQLG